MDGYRLLREIRTLEQGVQIPTLALTAYAGEISQQQALDAGFPVHLLKPVEPQELVKAIAQLVKLENS